jgi:hypothetical protein
VRCRSAGIPVDGQWDKLDRRGLCLNDKIVKVKITDTCALCLFTKLTQRQTPSLRVHGDGSAHGVLLPAGWEPDQCRQPVGWESVLLSSQA